MALILANVIQISFEESCAISDSQRSKQFIWNMFTYYVICELRWEFSRKGREGGIFNQKRNWSLQKKKKGCTVTLNHSPMYDEFVSTIKLWVAHQVVWRSVRIF